MLSNSISSLLLSLSLTNSLLSDVSTLALLLVSFKESQYIAHTTLHLSLSSFLSPGGVSHTPRCSSHMFFPTVFCVVTSSVPQKPGLPSFPSVGERTHLQAKGAGASVSLTPSSPSPSPRWRVLWSITAPDVVWMICCESALVDRMTRRGTHGSGSLAQTPSSIACNYLLLHQSLVTCPNLQNVCSLGISDLY